MVSLELSVAVSLELSEMVSLELSEMVSLELSVVVVSPLEYLGQPDLSKYKMLLSVTKQGITT